jgi:hypothetical protein
MLKSCILFLLFAVGLFISCKKETATLPSAVNHFQSVPKAFAGTDVYIIYPVNSCMLKGSAQYPINIKTTSWKKISGSGSFVIENSTSFETKLSNLETGVYAFEFSITNTTGLTGKDTVWVTVLEEGTGKNERVFKDQQWSCPMGCNIRIENFYSFIPPGTAFKVYVKRDHSTEWVEVVNMSQGWSKYMWTIYNNGLEIQEDQTENPEDTPDVKIVF